MTRKPTYEELEQRIKDLQKEVVEYNQTITSLQKSEEHCRAVTEYGLHQPKGKNRVRQ